MLRLAVQALGWRPAEFWTATIYEFETAILSKVREIEPEPWSDEQSRDFFDRLGSQAQTT